MLCTASNRARDVESAGRNAVAQAVRYSNALVLTQHCCLLQIIVKEKGVFSNVTSPSTKAKLRLLFEVAPLALLVSLLLPLCSLYPLGEKETKRKDCTFWRCFNEKPGTIPGCPTPYSDCLCMLLVVA